MEKLDELCPLCGGEVQQRYSLDGHVTNNRQPRDFPLLVSCASRECGWFERRKVPKKPKKQKPGKATLSAVLSAPRRFDDDPETLVSEIRRAIRPPLRTRLYRWCRWNAMVFGAGGVFHRFFWDDAARALGKAVEWVAMLAGN